VPTVKTSSTLAAVGDRVNVMAGSQYEYPSFPARVRVKAVGNPGDSPNIEVYTGDTLIMQSSPLDELAVTIPLQDLHGYLVEDVIDAGERIGVFLQATAAGDIVRTEVHIIPIAT
jgi:hypothetical protein